MTSRAERLGHAGPGPARIVAEVVAASVIAAVGMGVLWWLLVPDVMGVVVDGRLVVDSAEGRKLFGRDAVFAMLGGGFGLVLGIAFTTRHRRHPITSLVALVVVGTAGSALAWLVGSLLGPDGDVGTLANSARAAFPLDLGSAQALVAWPFVAAVAASVIVLFREDPAPWVMPGPARHGDDGD